MASSSTYASASLYVGDLLPEVTEALLFERFNSVGPVASVRVCRDAATRRSLGYAYINFHRNEDAERALDTMNFGPIRGKPCRIMWSHRDPQIRKSGVGNIFVKNLSTSIDNKSLYDTFSMFGNILSCKVSASPSGGNLGYGFVHYENKEAAENAIARVNGKVIAGRQVTVSFFKPKEQRTERNKFTNVFVKNIPLNWSKEQFVQLFMNYGNVTSNLLVIDQNGVSKGFGFINYSSPEEANKAIAALHDKQVGTEVDKKLFVSRAQKKSERERELRTRFERLKLQRQTQYQGVNLYVKNLGDEVDDAKLKQDFSQFGEITSAKVMLKNGKSRGFGFVCFTNTESATRAIAATNGQMINGKPLYVSMAQRKDLRRTQLEAQFAQRAKMGMGQMPPQMGQMGQMGPHGGMFQRPPQPMFYQPQRMVPYGQPGVPPMVGQYPGQMMRQPGMAPGVPPGVPGVPPQMMRQPYQMMPAMMNNRVPPRQRRAPMKEVDQQAPQLKYADNVRNRNRNNQANMAAIPQSVPTPQNTQRQQAMPGTEVLTIKALAAAPEEQKKTNDWRTAIPSHQGRTT